MTKVLTPSYTGLSPNTRRDRPSPRRVADRHPVISARPTTFVSWWDFGLTQATVALDDPPIRIHDEDRIPDHQRNRTKIIVGWPFSGQFERFTSGKRPRSPFTAALASLYNSRRIQSHEWQILAALLSGHTDSEVVRVVTLGAPSRDYFEAAAIRALTFVWDRAQGDLAKVVDPPAPAGAA